MPTNQQITQFGSLWEKLSAVRRLHFIPECRHDDHGEIFRQLIQVQGPLAGDDEVIDEHFLGDNLVLKLFRAPVVYTQNVPPVENVRPSESITEIWWEPQEHEFIGSITSSEGRYYDEVIRKHVWVTITYGVTLEVYDLMIKLLVKFNTPRT